MRSEMSNVVESILKSLTLLSQRLDYETAPYRLEEFNAIIEDPGLWNDQDRAQKLMRVRSCQGWSQSPYEFEVEEKRLHWNVRYLKVIRNACDV